MKTFPVAEIFGPTIQGEGRDQGTPCHFIRLGGCDYKCEWCDTPHAVLPELVRRLPRLTTDEIAQRVCSLAGSPEWIIISGGNPVMHDLSDLLHALHHLEYKVSIETQGSRWKDWVALCDLVCVSPKPPSSQMHTEWDTLDAILHRLQGNKTPHFLKVVVFDQKDYDYAAYVHSLYPDIPFYVSAGNDAGSTVGNPGRKDGRDSMQVARDLIHKGRWLANRVMVDPVMKNAKVQMQQHVLYWGNEVGR
jgi:7-carboxy-7-deazaguanine synthase